MKNLSIYIISILFLGFIAYLSFIAKKYEPKYRVENLVIENNKIIPSDLLLEYINVKDKSSLKDISAEMILDRIEKHPYVKRAQGVFVDSTTFKVTIEEVEPFLMFITGDGNYIITKDNNALPEIEKLSIIDLPVVTMSYIKKQNIKTIKKRELFDLAHNCFNKIYETDRGLFATISEMNIDNNFNLSLYLTKPKAKIIVGKEFDKNKALYISEFWRQIILNTNHISYDYIDLRFNEQIVVKHSNNFKNS